MRKFLHKFGIHKWRYSTRYLRQCDICSKREIDYGFFTGLGEKWEDDTPKLTNIQKIERDFGKWL